MYKFKVKVKDNCLDKAFSGVGRIIRKKQTIINLNEEDLPKKCIMIGNHSGARGPMTYRAYINHRFMTWGAHQMVEGYPSRWKYLYHVFYQQKLHYSKFKSFFLATTFGIISKWVYNYAGIIPIYYDMKIRKTFEYSLMCLEKDVSVFVFPENSDNGYKEKIGDFFQGFLKLSEMYYRQKNVDLPIYPLFYDKYKATITIGKPLFYQEIKQNYSKEEALVLFANKVNELAEIEGTKENGKN